MNWRLVIDKRPDGIDERARLTELTQMASRYLSSLPGVTRVWLFGSVAKGRRLDWRSDLDFAVEGLPSTELCHAWSELDVLLKHSVDLVRWEEAGDSLRREIASRGILVYPNEA